MLQVQQRKPQRDAQEADDRAITEQVLNRAFNTALTEPLMQP
jgi:hypothetical protein